MARKDEEEELHGGVQQDQAAERKLLLDWSIPLGTGRVRKPRPVDLADPPFRSSRPVSPDGAVTFHFRHEFVSLEPAGKSKGMAVRDDKGREVPLRGIAREAELRSFFPDMPAARRSRATAAGVELQGEGPGPEPYFGAPHPARPKAARGNVKRDIASRAKDAARRAGNWGSFGQELKRSGLVLVKGSGSTGRGSRPAGAAADHQSYIERAGRYAERKGGVEIAEDGTPSSFGTIGPTLRDRMEFWHAVEARERDGGRVQSRLIVELPHELDPIGRRELVMEFARIFDDKGLPWHAVVHVPDVHGDRRNYHTHIDYHDRPVERLPIPLPSPSTRASSKGWTFAEAKDRTARGTPWILQLRRRFAEVANEKLKLAGVAKRYDPRRYEEMGIPKRPGVHLGPKASALERSGVLTEPGASTIAREQEFEIVTDGRRLASIGGIAIDRAKAIGAWPRGRSVEAEAIRREAFDVASRWLDAEFAGEGEYANSVAARRRARDAGARARAREDWHKVKGVVPAADIRARSDKEEARKNNTPVAAPRSGSGTGSEARVNEEARMENSPSKGREDVAPSKGREDVAPSKGREDAPRMQASRARMLGARLTRLEHAWRAENLLDDRKAESVEISRLGTVLADPKRPPEMSWREENDRLRGEARDLEAAEARAMDGLIRHFRDRPDPIAAAREAVQAAVAVPAQAGSGNENTEPGRLAAEAAEAAKARRRREALLARNEAIERRGDLGKFVLPKAEEERLRDELTRRRALVVAIDREIAAFPMALARADATGIGAEVRRNAREQGRSADRER